MQTVFAVDEIRILTGKPFDIGAGIKLYQPSMEEIAMFGEDEYLKVISAFTSEPFDVPYYLDKVGIDFEEIKPFELFCMLVSPLSQQSTKLLFGDLDFSKFKIATRGNELIMINSDGIIIDSLLRERLADNIRRIHCLPKNILKSCENKTTHDLMIYQQKKEITRLKRKKEMFGERSAYGALISSLACEWHDYDKVLKLNVGQFFDAIARLGYKQQATNLCSGIYSGKLSYKDINKKDLDWMRPIQIKPL